MAANRPYARDVFKWLSSCRPPNNVLPAFGLSHTPDVPKPKPLTSPFFWKGDSHWDAVESISHQSGWMTPRSKGKHLFCPSILLGDRSANSRRLLLAPYQYLLPTDAEYFCCLCWKSRFRDFPTGEAQNMSQHVGQVCLPPNKAPLVGIWKISSLPGTM